MKVTVFVPPDDWNSHYTSPEDHILAGAEFGESKEGSEFQLARLEVGACTTYRIVDGKPVPVVVSFPDQPKETP